LDGAHVEYFRGIQNPIGIKVGPSMKPQELIDLLDVVDPNFEIGKKKKNYININYFINMKIYW